MIESKRLEESKQLLVEHLVLLEKDRGENSLCARLLEILSRYDDLRQTMQTFQRSQRLSGEVFSKIFREALAEAKISDNLDFSVSSLQENLKNKLFPEN